MNGLKSVREGLGGVGGVGKRPGPRPWGGVRVGLTRRRVGSG